MLTAAADRSESADALSEHFQNARRQVPRSPRTVWLRLGDAVVQVVSDHSQFLEEMDAYYGDCRTTEPASRSRLIQCCATALDDPRFLLLRFEGGQINDPLEIALGLYRPLRRQWYSQKPSAVTGLSTLVTADSPRAVLLAGDGQSALIDLLVAPPEFVLDCLVDFAQSTQPGVMFLHAASVGVGGSGALLLGPTQAGKSTNALAIARHGHAFLGDDKAAVRMATRELLPFPKSAGLRDGPLAILLSDRMQHCRHIIAPGRNGELRTVVRVADLFPASTSGPLPLQFAFFLDGRQSVAEIAPFQPGTADLLCLRGMVVVETNSSWGKSAGRDLMQLLAVVDLLSHLRCYRVKPGSTEDTARLIEAQCLMERAR